jgi:hypothetical protein
MFHFWKQFSSATKIPILPWRVSLQARGNLICFFTRLSGSRRDWVPSSTLDDHKERS